jgi:ADP-heptose:LPS heptosyltransferase/glycosyltransferase involved in cell wall biosynthesis
VKPKLLIIELWGVGDLVVATPFLRAACEKFEVTLVAKPYALDLQPRFWPDVQVLPFVAPWTAFTGKYRLWRWPWLAFGRLGRRLIAKRFDVGLSARWDPRDHFLLFMAGARKRLGFPRLGSQVFLNHALTSPHPDAHRYEYWRTVAAALELELPVREAIPLPPAPQGYILLHTGAAQSVRVWPLERFRNLARRLRERGLVVQIACDSDQQGWWLAMGELGVAAPKTITELMALTDRAGLFIGNDSGPGHLAAFAGTPTFSIFGPQLPERFSPLHPASEWIEGWECPHRPCSDYCHFPLARCLWDLSEESVWARVEKFVARHAEGLAAIETPTRAPARVTARTARPLKLLQVFNRYLMPGGEENSVARIAAHLELAGHEVTRYWRASAEWTATGSPSKLRQLFLTLNNPAALEQLREIHEKVRPDAWICHNLVPVISFGAYRLARELGVPIIHWLHNYRPVSPSGALRAGNRTLEPNDPFLVWKEIWSGSWRGRFLTTWLALGYRRVKRRGDFDAVKAWIAVSDEMKRTFEAAGFPNERLHVLHHSWDIQPPVGTGKDEGYFLFLGRMIEDKGVKFLIELWQRPEFQGVPLVMAGQGPLADYYRHRTPPNIRWIGFVRGAEKRRLVAGCRAVLFPCLWTEPLSTVVYEAYEQGRPVLASNLGGLKDLISDGQTGRLLKPGDTETWSKVLQQFIRDPEMSRAMGERGLRWLNEHISPAAWNQQFDEIISKTLKKS